MIFSKNDNKEKFGLDQVLKNAGLAFWALAFVFFSYQFFTLQSTRRIQTGIPVGELFQFYSLRSRLEGELNWHDVSRARLIYANEKFFTGAENARAIFSAKDGGRLFLGPNSLVTFLADDRGATLLNLQGSATFLLEGGEHFLLVHQGQTIEIDGEKSSIQILASRSQLSLKVTSGLAKVGHLRLGEGQEVRFQERAGPKIVTEKKIILLEGPPFNHSYLSVNLPVPIIFSAPSGEVSFYVKNLKNNHVDFYEIKGKERKVSVELNEFSAYEWGIDNRIDGQQEVRGEFRIVERRPVKFLNLIDSKVVVEGKDFFHLSWLASGDELLSLDFYSKKGKEVKFNLQTSEHDELISPKIPEGLGLIKYRTSFKGETIERGELPYFFSKGKEELLLNMPLERQVFQFFGREGHLLELKWTSTSEFSRLQVVKLGPKGINKKILMKDLRGQSFTLSALEEGDYLWSVEANGQKDSGHFQVVIHEGTIEALEIKLSRPDEKVDFFWQQDDGEMSVFEVGSDKNFENVILKKEMAEGRYSMTFPVLGTFYWRVRKTSENKFFAPRKVILTPAPPPPKIQLDEQIYLKIRKKSSGIFERIIDFFVARADAEERDFVELHWPVEERAKSYLIKIFSSENTKKTIIEREVSENIFFWRGVTPGTYFFQVAIKDHWGRIGDFSNLAKLIVENEKEKLVKKRVSSRGSGQISVIAKKNEEEIIPQKMLKHENKRPQVWLGLDWARAQVKQRTSQHRWSALAQGGPVNGLQVRLGLHAEQWDMNLYYKYFSGNAFKADGLVRKEFGMEGAFFKYRPTFARWARELEISSLLGLGQMNTFDFYENANRTEINHRQAHSFYLYFAPRLSYFYANWEIIGQATKKFLYSETVLKTDFRYQLMDKVGLSVSYEKISGAEEQKIDASVYYFGLNITNQ